ncbi:bryoporin-like [Siniperca chuatsi]|uniref:bryoporin-like n=1 Tax=Siniperca chuatsi TaxID=119488 RepID=UPI001CE14334|nr:bryoporin-like [Siniperca chuatsi]
MSSSVSGKHTFSITAVSLPLWTTSESADERREERTAANKRRGASSSSQSGHRGKSAEPDRLRLKAPQQVEDTMTLPTHRQCTIELENKCSAYTLCNPHVSTVSGSCAKALPPTLSPSESGSALFIKTPDTACGSVGVLTYDLQNASTEKCDGKMAVMFSVPYDFNVYSNWYAVGVFDENKVCDNSLYEEMYHNAENGFVRGQAKDGGLTYKGKGVAVRATMSDSYTPVIEVQVCIN